MTATLELASAHAPGPRELRRIEDRRRRRVRYRRVGFVLAVVAATALLAVLAPHLWAAGSGGTSVPADALAAVGASAPTDATGPVRAPADASAPADAGAGASTDERARVHLLNGVGSPGIATRVREQLPEDEFRVVVADNAPEFGVRETRVLVYDDDAASLAVAQRLRDVLGVGTISVSRQPQSVVDVTVIIGRDIDGS